MVRSVATVAQLADRCPISPYYPGQLASVCVATHKTAHLAMWPAVSVHNGQFLLAWEISACPKRPQEMRLVL